MMEESTILRILLMIIITLSNQASSLMKCPQGIRSYGAYPDEVDDPSYYYDCSKTRIAVLKRCKSGEFYDQQKSKCIIFPRELRSRSFGGSSFRKEGPAPAKKVPKSDYADPSLNPEITRADMEQFLKTRKISEQLRVPALGRPVRLGAMFYGDEERIAYDENLWRDSTLKANKSVDENPSSSFKIKQTNDVLMKMTLFNVEGSLSLSIASGKIQVSGSAKMLKDEKKTEKMETVSFMYQSIRQIEYINQDLRLETDFPELCKDVGSSRSAPTHVVTSITRGCNAVLVFNKYYQSATDENKIAGHLKATISLGVNISGEVTINMTENQTELVEDLEVVFYGDIILDKNPTNYEAAQEAMASISEKSKESNTVIFYDLSPIDKYCDERAAILNELNEEKIEKAMEIMQEFEIMKAKVNDLMDRKAAKMYYHTIGKTMAELKVEYDKYTTEWKQNLSIVLPKIKTNLVAESKLITMLNTHIDNALNLLKASFFMDNRRREMDTVDMIIEDKPADVVIQETGNGKGNICIFKHVYLVQYTLHILPGENMVKNYIEKAGESLDKYNENDAWFNSERMVAKAGFTHLYFTHFRQKNVERKDICFLINLKPSKDDFKKPKDSAQSKQPCTMCPLTLQCLNSTLIEKGESNQLSKEELDERLELHERIRVDVFKAGDQIACNMMPPKKLKVPDVVTVDYDTLDFKVPYGLDHAKQQNIGNPEMNRIRIEYSYEREEKVDEDSERTTTKNSTNSQLFKLGPKKETKIKLRNLKAGEQYFISVFVVYEFGVEPDSTSFKMNTTECSTPKSFKVDKITPSSIKLSWIPPAECIKKKSVSNKNEDDSIEDENDEDATTSSSTVSTTKMDSDSEPKITYKILYRNYSRSNAKDGRLDTANVKITNDNGTEISGLQPSTQYEFTIEAILSKTSKVLAPPPPKTIHNNERSMIKAYTQPEFPQNLDVILSETNKHEADVTWDAIKTDIDGFKIVYSVNVTRLHVNDTACEAAKKNMTKNGAPLLDLPEQCDYDHAHSDFYETSENKLKIRNLHPGRLYYFKVQVRTPHGDSQYSPPIIRNITLEKANKATDYVPEVDEMIKARNMLTTQPIADYNGRNEDYAEEETIIKNEDKAAMDSIPESVYLDDFNSAKNSSEQSNANNNERKADYAEIENAYEIGVPGESHLENNKRLLVERPEQCNGQLPCRCFGNTCLGGGGLSEGNVYVNGLLVCNHCWDGVDNGENYKECENWKHDRNAIVICNQLGFKSGQAAFSGRYNSRNFDGIDPLYYFDGMIKCDGTETDIESCPKFKTRGMKRCGNNDAASVICKYD